MSEAACAAFRLADALGQAKFRPLVPSEHRLRDTVTVMDRIGLLPPIDQRDIPFSPIIAVYGADSVDQANPVFDRQPGSGSDLGFHTLRNFNKKSCRNQSAFPRL